MRSLEISAISTFLVSGCYQGVMGAARIPLRLGDFLLRNSHVRILDPLPTMRWASVDKQFNRKEQVDINDLRACL